MSISAELAKRIVALQYEDLPLEAIDTAKMAILDVIGVTLAGAHEEATTAVERVLGSDTTSGQSLVFGRDYKTTCLNAALINSVAAHALDFDDCSNTLGGHPSAPIFPALIALAEEVGAGGRDVLLAYIVGFETEARIARAVNFHHYQKGWHPTATLGIFGSAAACSKLLALPEEIVATALSLSVSLASGVKASFGTMTKALQVGQSSRNGLLAALLAREGFTANPAAFEDKAGFLDVFNGAGTYCVDKVLEHWADPLDIVAPGVAIKQYPCCGSTHPAIDAMIRIVSAHKIERDQVSEINAWIHPRRLMHTNRLDPQSAQEARFSLHYCLARTLMDGDVRLEHFQGDAFRDPEARRIMKRVNAAPYTDAQFDSSNHFGAEVQVKLVDGHIYSAKVQSALGRTSSNPLSPERLRMKFESCAMKVLSREQVTQLYSTIRHLERVRRVREMTAMIATTAAAQHC